jgi:hypothetical protein
MGVPHSSAPAVLRAAAAPLAHVRLHDVIAARRDVRRCGAARSLRAAARRTRAPPASATAHPLRSAQRAAAAPLTPARLHDLVTARRDV